MNATERERELKYLIEDIGVDPEEAPLRLQDNDLWLVEPAARFVLEGEGGRPRVGGGRRVRHGAFGRLRGHGGN